jgi:ParB-like chromosome segregation protein Spo0J
MTPKQIQAVADFEKLPAWDAPRLVPVDCLEFTDWNVNEMNDAEFSELVAEIEETGFDEPLGVMPIPGEEGRYLVPSGEHRARAAIALEMDAVPCVLKVHLTEVDEAEVKMWTVKRNNVRGRLNAQKYADLERGLSEKHQIRAKVARERMLVKGQLLKDLRKNAAIAENEDGGGSESRGGTEPSSGDDMPPPPTEGVAAKKTLLAALKAAEEEVLLQSADTVEHGYLFFIQGDGGGTHLVVDESNTLHDKVTEMVDVCRRDKAEVDAFLVNAINMALAAKSKE